jgi:hypothetical protein
MRIPLANQTFREPKSCEILELFLFVRCHLRLTRKVLGEEGFFALLVEQCLGDGGSR